MTHLTDEELDEQFTGHIEVALDPNGAWNLITSLRSQLAYAKANCDEAWKVAHASTDRGMKAEARADRAEAALDQIISDIRAKTMREAAVIAADHTPGKHMGGTLAAHVTGATIEKAILTRADEIEKGEL